jgi:hypothetical protein
MQAQLITREEGLRLLKLPDLDDTLALENAREDFARMVAYQILRLGKMPAIEPASDIMLCVVTLEKEIMKAEVAGLSIDSDNIRKARAWMTKARTAKARADAAQAALSAPPGPPPAPIARGAPVPVAQLAPMAAPGPGSAPPPPPGTA